MALKVYQNLLEDCYMSIDLKKKTIIYQNISKISLSVQG